MEFRYYYGSQADQFSFIRIPRALLTDEAFAPLSIPSKLLYGLLLDRMGLSMKNGWFDEENRVYIIYQIAEIQEDLGLSKKKAIEYLNELEKFGLVEKKRRGLGLPSILFIKSFLIDRDCLGKSAADPADTETSRGMDMDTSDWETENDGTSGGVGNGTSEDEYSANHMDAVSENTVGAARNSGTCSSDRRPGLPVLTKDGLCGDSRDSKTGCPRNEGSEICRSVQTGSSRGVQMGTSRSARTGTSRGAEISLQEVPDRELQEVPEWEPLNSYTKTNNTDLSDTEQNHILSDPSMRSDEIRACTDLVEKNIGYKDLLRRYPQGRDLVKEIHDLILEVLLSQGSTLRIASNQYPAQLVKSRFLELGYEHIEYVIGCFEKNTTKIKNIKKYLLTALFNAPSTISGYYTAQVHHDMPHLAVQKG